MKKALRIYVRVWLFLLPLLILPIVTDAYGWGKNWLLVVGAMLGMIIWAIGQVGKSEGRIKTSSWVNLLGLMLVVTVASWFKLAMGARWRGAFNPMGAGTILSWWMWSFLWLQVKEKDEAKSQVNWLTAGSVVAGVLSLAVFLLPPSRLPISIPSNKPWLTISQNWTSVGTVLSEIFLMAFLAVEWIRRLVKKISQDNGYIREGVVVAVLALSLFLGVYKAIKSGLILLDSRTTWAIAAETLKRQPWWGVGIGNYGKAFDWFRPESFNFTPNWAVSFNSGAMWLLQWWTEAGLLGLAVMALLISAWFKRREKKAVYWLGGLWLAVWLLTPATLVTPLLVSWWMVNRVFESKEKGLVLRVGESGWNAMPTILATLVVVPIVWGGYWWTRGLVGEVYLKRSIRAASANDGAATYQLQAKAIEIMPANPEYRRFFSQTNLAIAQNLLVQEEATEEQKQQAAALIQNSVAEAKAAVALDGNRAVYWNNLAVIYRALIGTVDGVADYSLQAYQQAAALDPANPMIKMDLGGLYYAAGMYEEADRVFEEAVKDKTDYANAWYNWAYSAKQLNRLGDAVTRLNQAVNLVPVDTDDYEDAVAELKQWKTELDAAVAAQAAAQVTPTPTPEQEVLTTPEPLPTMSEEEKVEVPAEELEPPEAVVTPTPEENSN